MLPHQHAAIYVQHVPGNVSSLVGSKKRRGAGNILCTADPSHGNSLHGHLPEVFAQRRGHRRFDKAGRDRITGNIAGSHFACNGHGQSNQAGFGCRIVCLSGLAHLPKYRGDIYDPAPALLEHGADRLLRAQVSRSQIGVHYKIPIGSFHTHDQLVFRDSGIVHQNVESAELREHIFEGGFDLLFVTDIEHKRCGLSAAGCNLSCEMVELLLITRGQRDAGTQRSKFERARSADSLRRSSDQGHAISKSHNTPKEIVSGDYSWTGTASFCCCGTGTWSRNSKRSKGGARSVVAAVIKTTMA